MNKDQELLTITMEECAEVIYEASKLIRFGDQHLDTMRLEKEIGDLICMFDLMSERDWIRWDKVHEQASIKEQKLKKWSSLFNGD